MKNPVLHEISDFVVEHCKKDKILLCNVDNINNIILLITPRFITVVLFQIHTFIGKEKFRQVLESDDINSVLKSPIIKSRKKRRKRSSWATGVIKKAKKPVKNADEAENEQPEEPQKDQIHAIESAPRSGILVKSEEPMDTSVVEGPNLESLEDSRVQVKHMKFILRMLLFLAS